MKIAILSSASAGGAGIAAYRIYEALKSSNYNADFIDINTLGESVCQEISPQVSATNKKITNTHFTVDHASDCRDWLISFLSEYDVINVQWASYLISLSEILELAKLNKKIVFTLHDFYYITGGCHYPAGCKGHLENCIGCPQVNDNVLSMKNVIKANKIKREIFSYPNVHLTAPSKFIVDNAVRAGFVPNERAHVLRNSYDTTEPFNSLEKPKEKSILLIADSFDEQRKGLALAVDSLKLASEAFKEDSIPVTLHLVGGLDKEVIKRLDSSGIKVITHGHIKEHKRLVQIFKQCHFILSCSYEDNWPNILVESGCYGCIPIVGPWHGCEEFTQKFNVGFISEEYTPIAFAKEIKCAISEKYNSIQVSEFVNNVRETCTPKNISNAYSEVFLMKANKELTTKVKNKKSVTYSLNKIIDIHPSPFGPQLAFKQKKLTVCELLKASSQSKHIYGIVDFRYK